MENIKMFTTKDIYLATTLITLSFRMEGIDFQYEGNKPRPIGYFRFEDSDDLRRAKDDYWQGRLAIEPRTFITNMRGIKAQLETVYKAPSYNSEATE